MLKGIAPSGAVGPGAFANGNGVESTAQREKAISGSGSNTPGSFGAIGSEAGTPASEHKVNLLNLFKSP